MAKYNIKREPVVKKTTTHQGGTGFTQAPENELIGMLATGLDNTFYEKESERTKRFAEVFNAIARKNKTFAAKALVYARTVFGQRSITHFGAVELLPHLQGDPLGKRFFSKRSKKGNIGGIIYRLDDMAEILAAYMVKNKIASDAVWTVPNSIKKGFKDAIEHADAYELAKYQMKSRGVSLVDIVNLVHPKETSINGYVNIPMETYLKAVKGTKFEKMPLEGVQGDPVNGPQANIPALRALVLGILKQFNTVEDKNTEAGKDISEKVKAGIMDKDEAAQALVEKKTDNYRDLIKTKKIGYLALLRNLRNIIKTEDESLLDEACDLLVNRDFIRKSLVWPHQIDLALEVMLLEFSGRSLGKVTKALDIAYENSIPNLENLLPAGRTAVVFDTSGSMGSNWKKVAIGKGQGINKQPVEKAALVAATFAKGIYGDVYHFANHAEKITGWNPNDSINTLKRHFMSFVGRAGHGTEFGACFNLFARTNEKYDRVIIISDEQDGYGKTESDMKAYTQKFGTPYVYIINVCGYENVGMKPGQRVFRLYGYTQDIYEHINKVEIDPKVIIKAINEIQI